MKIVSRLLVASWLALASLLAGAQTFPVQNLVVNGTMSGAGLTSHDASVNHVQTVANITALRGLVCLSGLLYSPQGYYTIGDGGGGGIYVCNGADTTTADNGFTVIAAANSFRMFLTGTSGTFNVMQAGAKCDGTTDDTARFQAAVTVGGNLLIPPKTCISGPLSVTNSLTINAYGATVLQKAGTAVNSSAAGIFSMLVDKTLTIHGGTFDGNLANQTATFGNCNFIWDAAGSLKMYDVTVQNTPCHGIRTGNIDNFNSSVFAHDVVLDNIRVLQCITTSGCGDSVRIERTNHFRLTHSFIYGGLSSVRTQLYDSDLFIDSNESSYAWGDVGITVAMSQGIVVTNNSCHNNFSHGIESDAVVDSYIGGNVTYANGASGFQSSQYGASQYTNSATYWGSIATGHGTNYSNQTFTSPQVPNINQVYANNVAYGNAHADRLIGLTGDVYEGNFSNNATLSGGYASQLNVEGGTLNTTANLIINNTFVDASTDTSSVAFSNYQFDAFMIGNRGSNKLVPIANFGAKGMRDANAGNNFLLNPALRTSLLFDINDSTSPSGTAVSHTTTGSQTYEFSGIYGGGAPGKLMRVVARVNSGTQSATLALQLYNAANTFVATLASSSVTLTSSYQEFFLPVSSSTSVGAQLKVDVTIPVTGIQVYFVEANVFVPTNN